MKLDSRLEREMNHAFEQMDREFTEALKRHDNVYLDLQLVETPRKGLPEAYQNRILLNEGMIHEYSQPTRDNERGSPYPWP